MVCIQETCESIVQAHSLEMQKQAVCMQISFCCRLHPYVQSLQATEDIEDQLTAVMDRIKENAERLNSIRQRETSRFRSEHNALSYMRMTVEAVLAAYQRTLHACLTNNISFDFSDISRACKGVRNEVNLRNAIILGLSLHLKRYAENELKGSNGDKNLKILSRTMKCDVGNVDEHKAMLDVQEAVTSNLRNLIRQKRGEILQKRANEKHRLRVQDLERSILEKRLELESRSIAPM